MSEVDAGKSHAVVVGIERYDAGPTWNLDGPASDAVRFLGYLQQRGVPKANVSAFLSPLAANAALTDRTGELAATVTVPTQAALDDLIEQRWPQLKTDFLLLFWAGHGVITIDDERRLYTADATAAVKRNVDVNSLLASLRSGVYPTIPRQALVIDTCANYIPNPTDQLTQKTYTRGTGMAGVDQSALFAASPGEYAKNLNDEKAGLMSRELLPILMAQDGTTWPPDLVGAAEALAARFATLRKDRKTRQTPSSLWFRSPIRSGEYRDGGKYLGEIAVDTSGIAIRVPRALTNAETKSLVDALLAVDSMRSEKNRDWIVRNLPREVGTTIKRRDSDRLDTLMILERCRYYDRLVELLRSVDVLEGQSPAFRQLVAVAHHLLPDEVPETIE